MLGIGGRISAIIPIIASTVAVALSIVMLAAGTQPSNAGDNFWLSMNTSKVGQDIIKVQAANNTNGNGGGGGGGGGLIPGITDPTGITQGIGNAVGGLLGNITNSIGEGVQDIQGQLVGNLTQLLGVKDNYRLYLTKICEATYADDNNPKSKVTIDNCKTYDDKTSGLRNITDNIPSSFVLGTANVSVPLVAALAGTLNQVGGLGSGGAKALTAFLAIGTTCVGIVLLATLPILLFGFVRALVLVSLVFSLLASITLPTFAVILTALVYGARNMLNKTMDAFGIQIQAGGSFIAMAWVAAVASMAAATYWFMVWFVSFRRTAFSRRKRTENEIGNWRGIFREVKGDLKTWEGGEK
ncbi:uncharacterized protein LY79DRAFT_563775 [Colletotrichum navitas]|uniref:Sur7 protein n=1 Tax=Colletotrichum navitas TaxID=681940 RepID=A0AAD8UZS7_9PEZI|nr:uncharacterized protein LY79DRAFT_563775 [Colletotrichum navitas]KAK1579605.1 hypothetical protein LY79DRAFT_563775 [Colletotrichum navitas]